LAFDPTDPNSIPQSNKDLSDLILFRLEVRKSQNLGYVYSLANLLSKNINQDLVAKEKLTEFLNNNPDIYVNNPKKRRDGTIPLGAIRVTSENSTIIRALRER
jgi:hypothetical protein